VTNAVNSVKEVDYSKLFQAGTNTGLVKGDEEQKKETVK